MNKEDIKKILVKIKHPAINLNLLELGMIKNFNLEKNIVKITFTFPFPGIPIKDQIIESVRKPLESAGLKMVVETSIMNPEELQNFLRAEQENWKN